MLLLARWLCKITEEPEEYVEEVEEPSELKNAKKITLNLT